MMRFAADENFDGRVFRGLLARLPDADILRVQDTPLYEAPDDVLLAWLAAEGRVLLTHDLQTMPAFVYERIAQGLAVPGIIEVRMTAPIGQIINELEVLIGAGQPEDFENIIRYVPMR
jgi:hypothetical protein